MAIKLCFVISRRVELQHIVRGICSALKGVVHEKTQNHDDDNDVDDDNNNDDDDDDNVHTFILLIRVL